MYAANRSPSHEGRGLKRAAATSASNRIRGFALARGRRIETRPGPWSNRNNPGSPSHEGAGLKLILCRQNRFRSVFALARGHRIETFDPAEDRFQTRFALARGRRIETSKTNAAASFNGAFALARGRRIETQGLWHWSGRNAVRPRTRARIETGPYLDVQRKMRVRPRTRARIETRLGKGSSLEIWVRPRTRARIETQRSTWRRRDFAFALARGRRIETIMASESDGESSRSPSHEGAGLKRHLRMSFAGGSNAFALARGRRIETSEHFAAMTSHRVRPRTRAQD